MSISTTNSKKFLDAQGLTYFAQKLNDYPDNTVLAAVIDGIQDALDDKVDTSAKGAANGVASLDANGKVPTSQLPTGQSDVVVVQALADLPVTGDSTKLYVVKANKQTYVWSGQAYVEATITLGTNSTDAFRGDYGQAAYAHGVTNKGSAFSSGLYKITTNAEGHVTAATPVVKADITALGIPGSASASGGGGTTIIEDRLFLWELDAQEIAYYTDLYTRSVMNEYGDVMYDESGNPIYLDISESALSSDLMMENGTVLYTEDNLILQLG